MQPSQRLFPQLTFFGRILLGRRLARGDDPPDADPSCTDRDMGDAATEFGGARSPNPDDRLGRDQFGQWRESWRGL